jgi:50S ribosomal protein L4
MSLLLRRGLLTAHAPPSLRALGALASSSSSSLPSCAITGGAVRALATTTTKRVSRIVPSEQRFAFRQPNRRRDDKLRPRMPAAVPDISAGSHVQAWLSSWDEPRAGIVSLRSDVWAMPLRKDIVHRVFEWQRACLRQGTSVTLGRAEVSGGGKKPRPQKGTGRSRHGSIRSPIWVGGGNAFPKKQRDFSYKMNSKVVTLGIKTALSDKYRRGALVVMDDLHLDTDDPAELQAKLRTLGITPKQRGECRRPKQRPKQRGRRRQAAAAAVEAGADASAAGRRGRADRDASTPPPRAPFFLLAPKGCVSHSSARPTARSRAAEDDTESHRSVPRARGG